MSKVNKCDLILQAASEVFVKKGFEKSTVQEIAIQAGVGKGTIYEYFSSKEELFSQVIKNAVSYVYDDLHSAFHEVKSLEECIETFIRTSLYLIEQHSDKLQILFEDYPKADFGELQAWFVERHQQTMDMATTLIQQFMDNKELRQTQAEVVAWMVLDAIRLGFYYKITKKQPNIETILRAQMDIILNGTRGRVHCPPAGNGSLVPENQ